MGRKQKPAEPEPSIQDILRSVSVVASKGRRATTPRARPRRDAAVPTMEMELATQVVLDEEIKARAAVIRLASAAGDGIGDSALGDGGPRRGPTSSPMAAVSTLP